MAPAHLNGLEGDLGEMVEAGTLSEIPGVGETLRDKITTLVKTGALPFYDDLRKKTPPGLIEMLRVGGLGPKKVKTLYDELGVDDLDKLKAACEDDRVAKLKGFGKKTQQKVLEGVEFPQEDGRPCSHRSSRGACFGSLGSLRDAPDVKRIEVCGSLRRRKETIQDIDLLVSADNPRRSWIGWCSCRA